MVDVIVRSGFLVLAALLLSCAGEADLPLDGAGPPPPDGQQIGDLPAATDATRPDALTTSDGPCVPSCSGRECGDDGCGGSCGACPSGTLCDGTSGTCVSDCTPQTELCNSKDDDCDGKVDEDFPNKGKACDGADSDKCKRGTYTCKADGSGLQCVNESKTDIKEICDGVDNDCDGTVDDGLATDKGSFAGCKNYRALIDKSIALMNADATADGLVFRWTSSAKEEGGDRASWGLLARAELLLATKGVPLPAGARTKLIDQAILQAEGFKLWEAAGTKGKAVRSAAGLTHSCRGWFGESNNPVVGQYWTGPILLGLELLARVIYEDKLTGSYKTKADSYHTLVGQVIDHWLADTGSHFKSKSTSISGITKENWICMEEPSSSCTLSTGARAIKWNVTTFFWRAVGVWNDVDNKHKGSSTTYRRIRVARYVLLMKQDMLDSSGSWSDTKPYVWHSWADAPSSYPYIEDASHGAWDVGLMFEVWRGGWNNQDGGAIMGPGSASRFRHTYMDNLAIANNPCVGLYTDGSQQIVGNKYYGMQLKTGRRRALTEWIGMANKDVAYLEELYEDFTGACEGYVPTSWAQHATLGYARFIREIRKIRGE